MDTLLIPLGLFSAMVLTYWTQPFVRRAQRKRTDRFVRIAKQEISAAVPVLSIVFVPTTDTYIVSELPQLVVTMSSFNPDHSEILDALRTKYRNSFNVIEVFAGNQDV